MPAGPAGDLAVKRIAPFLAAAIALSPGGCGRGSGDAADLAIATRDSAGVRIVEFGDPAAAPLPSWRLEAEPTLTIGGADAAPEHELFGAVDAARTSAGAVAVANSGTREVRVYDAAGAHVSTLGGQGRGPGEFGTLSWVGVADGDTLVAYDVFLRRMTWFAPDGRVARTLALEEPARGSPEPLGLSRGRLFVRSGFNRLFGEGERRDTVAIYLYHESGSIGDTLGTYPGPERFFYTAPDGSASMQLPPIYGRTVYAHAAGGRLAVGASDDFSIDVYDGSELSLKIRGRAPLRTANPADVDRERQSRRGSASGPMRQLRRDAVAATPARGTLPAFGKLLVDGEGWVWVQEHPRAPDEPARWTILDRGGIPRARLVTPPGLEVYEIGGSYLLGRRRDEDGVERIVLHRLQRG